MRAGRVGSTSNKKGSEAAFRATRIGDPRDLYHFESEAFCKNDSEMHERKAGARQLRASEIHDSE